MTRTTSAQLSRTAGKNGVAPLPAIDDEPAHDAHLACVVDALLVGCRVVPRPSPLRDALLRSLAGATTWRT